MQQFGDYEIRSMIGHGGMGEVYLAHDGRRDRDVALKLLPEALAKDPEYERRFRRESYAAARLREPHVIPIHDYGETDGRLYIDMRLVDGQSLAAVIRDEGALPAERAVMLIGQVAEALDAAHRDGLVHRDIKPSNVLVTPSDFVYVADFGLAHTVGHTQSRMTMTGVTLGTLDYMAPERFENGEIGPRTDVYSLACMLFETVTGTRPFPGGDLPSQMYAHMYVQPRLASEVASGVPSELDAVIVRGMAKDPQARFAGAGELAAAAREALRTAAAGAPTPAVPAPSTPGDDRTTRTPVAVGVGTLHDRAERGAVAPTGSGTAPGPAADASPAHREPPGPPRGGSADTPPPAVPPLPAPRGGSGRPQPSWNLTVGLVAIIVLLAGIAGVSLMTAMNSGTGARPAGGTPFVADEHAGHRSVASSVARPTVGATVPVGSTPGYMEIAPTGEFAYIANRAAGVITVFDTTRNVPTGTIAVPDGGPQFVAFSPDSTRAYVSIFNQDYTLNEVGVLDTQTGTIIARIPTGKRPFALDVSPDGKKVYVPNHDSGSLTVIDTATNTVAKTIQLAPNPHWVDFSPDGTRLYAANHESNIITILDPATDAVVGTVPVGKSPHSIVRHNTKPIVFNANYDDSTVSVTDVNSNRVIATIPTASHPQDITISPDGKHAYLATVDANFVQVLDTATFQVTAQVPTGKGPTSVAVGPDGRQAYVTNLLDGSVTVLNIAGTA